jgi:hypothetical protein
MTFASALTNLASTTFREALATDFAAVRFGNPVLAIWLAALLLGAVAITVVRLYLRRHKRVREHSGHHIARRFRKPLVVQVMQCIPKVILAVAVVWLILAAADPFLTRTERVASSGESRLRVDLVDVSGSMAWEFAGTGKSKAEVARDAHLKFLEMRRGKNDRVSLWLFSTYAYMVDDFVADDELYTLEVADAPFVMVEHLDRSMAVPRDRVQFIAAEGNSNIVRPLRGVIAQLDREATESGQKGGAHRAVLMITDAAVDEFPEAELAELYKRRIVPYIIFINPASEVIHGVPSGSPMLIQKIREYGGDYFAERDPEGIAKAYRAIDAREAVRYEVKHRAVQVRIYQRFVAVGLALLLAAALTGFAGEVLWGTYP